MNFANVKAITIPEGSVNQITDGNGVVIWKKAAVVDTKFHITNDDVNPITVSIKKGNEDAPTITLQVSDNGTSWTTLGNTSTTALNITIPVGGKKYIRSTSANAWGNSKGNNQFLSTGLYGAHGDIMTLLGYDTLKGYDCQSMFRQSPITTAPELPATILAQNCYNFMFFNCSSLTTAPELPATTLVNYCYTWMFAGCTSLNEIKCNATDISATSCTTYWVNNVAASGTFYKNPSMSSWTTGANGIPSGWTVQSV